MKTNAILRQARLYCLFPLLVSACVSAAPLTWFPGPPAGTAFSGAATVSDRNLGNVIIAGDNLYFPENLNVTNGVWNYMRTFSSSQIAPGAVDIGDFIIVYGGNNGTGATNVALAYSPSGDAPIAVPSMSVARAYLGYATDAGGSAYAIGGLDAAGEPLASAESYSQDANAWSAIASLPVAEYDFPAVFDNTNYIYIFGGLTNTTLGGAVATAMRYSVNANTWAPIAAMPVAVAGSCAAFGPDGKFYVVGGVSQAGTTNIVQVYDPSGDSWTVSTPLPEALSAACMSVDSIGRLIVMGGMNASSNDVADVWRSQQLGVPDSPPVLTQYPGTSAPYGHAYSSTIAATGNPQPTFSVVNGPAGLDVNLYSGLITWTPQGGAEIGNIAVTIQAANYAGATNYTFSITVPPPPPVIPTNFTVLAVNDNSATLSWSAEDPLVGPVTYKLYRITSAGKGGIIRTLYATSSVNVVTISLPTSVAYAFEVTATAGTITTGYSTEIVVVTTSPQPPPNVHLTALTSTSFSLAWNPAPGPAQSANYSAPVSYSIVHYVPFYGGYTLTPVVTGIPTNTTYGTVTGLTNGSGAFWIVQTIDAQGYGSSPTANILGITTPVPTAATMTVTAPPAGGGFQFSVTEGGSVLQTVYIQATTNLSDPNSWTQIGAEFPTANPFTFIDTNSSQFAARFYRVISP